MIETNLRMCRHHFDVFCEAIKIDQLDWTKLLLVDLLPPRHIAGTIEAYKLILFLQFNFCVILLCGLLVCLLESAV